MIKIRRGTQILTVPVKAYKDFYQANGWSQIVPESQAVPEVITPKKAVVPERVVVPEPETVSQAVSEWEQHIKSLTNKELKQLAQERGLEIAGASKKALTEALIKMGE